jgi:hypothetical protein
MAYKVNPDGSVQVDSLEEAIALSRRFAGSAAPAVPAEKSPALRDASAAAPSKPKAASQVGMSGWEMFASTRPTNQRRLLTALKNDGRLSLLEMQTVLGVPSNNAVTGVLSAIVKGAKRHGVEPGTVFVREEAGGVVTYGPGTALKVAATGFELADINNEEPAVTG